MTQRTCWGGSSTLWRRIFDPGGGVPGSIACGLALVFDPGGQNRVVFPFVGRVSLPKLFCLFLLSTMTSTTNYIAGDWNAIKQIHYRFIQQAQATSSNPDMHKVLNAAYEGNFEEESEVNELFADNPVGTRTQLRTDAVKVLKAKIATVISEHDDLPSSTDKAQARDKVEGLPFRWKPKAGAPVTIRTAGSLATAMTNFVNEG